MFKILRNLFSWEKMKENIQVFSRANAENNYFTRVVHKWHLQVQFIMRLVIIMSKCESLNNFSIVNAERTFLNLMSIFCSFCEKAFYSWNILTNVNWRFLYSLCFLFYKIQGVYKLYISVKYFLNRVLFFSILYIVF